MATQTNFEKFIKQFDKNYERFEMDRESFVKGVINKEYSEIIESSPVDTGYFRANHFIDIGNVNFRQQDMENFELESHKAKNVATLNGAKIKDGATIYIHNSLPYADRLENGWSSKNDSMYAKAKARADIIFKRGY